MARILVIDDESQLRGVLRRALESAGHDVVEAGNGDEALERFRAAPVDLVITDIIMPERDGLEVLMTLKREAPGIKIIAISGGGRFLAYEALDMAEPLGAFASLKKPFELKLMLATVERALAA